LEILIIGEKLLVFGLLHLQILFVHFELVLEEADEVFGAGDFGTLVGGATDVARLLVL
jgi:hypothetical protein